MIDVPVKSRVLAAILNPGALTLPEALESEQITPLLNDFNEKRRNVALALKAVIAEPAAPGTTVLTFQDMYPGISGKNVFADFDEKATAMRKDYAEILGQINAASRDCRR
jgi:hypothetical protein